ncbi:AraC family transcriptional regulator [Bremerella alba]|nr:xylose operon transcription regulator XylR [Bremerella alba]
MNQSPSRTDYRRVAVLIETDDSWGRAVVSAIGQHARQFHWRILIGPRDSQNRLCLPKGWPGEGVIVHLRTKWLANHVKKFNLPTVDVATMMPGERWVGRVATNDDERAEMAFAHFRERGLQNFACFAPSLGRYSDSRAEIFAQKVRQVGFHCSLFGAKEGQQGWRLENHHVLKWLAELPRPLGVFASDPYPARQLAEICDQGGLRVPDEVAILAGDDDDLLCNLAWPRLSAVQLGCHALGEEASKLLDRLMDGAPIPKETTFISPLRIHSRHSTDILAISDQELLPILEYIHREASRGLQVKELLRKFPVSRRSLEQRFRQHLGRSPAQEIRRVRLDRAKVLLLETTLAISEVSEACGFVSCAHFSTSFQKQFGMAPSDWRTTFGSRLSP